MVKSKPTPKRAKRPSKPQKGATTSKSSSKKLGNELKHFEALKPYMTSVAKGQLHRHRMFSLCVKASICKCFEFNLAARHIASGENAFFAMSSLRGICEDLIVLRYISSIPPNDRENLVIALSSYEVSTRIKLQDEFFTSFRPQQPVLRLGDVDNAIDASEAAARAVWNKHGWPGLTRTAMPQIRQIAEKQGIPQLAVLYDYLYRLTSGGVHFSVQSLLRSGWGSSPKKFVFSAKNFHPYFAEYCSLYGAFMFCLYFEFFGGVLRPSPKERAIVDKIREDVLFTRRWPEMVTFEEMNQKTPTAGETMRIMVSAVQAVSRKRLISKSVNYKNKRSPERQLLTVIVKALNQSSEG